MLDRARVQRFLDDKVEIPVDVVIVYGLLLLTCVTTLPRLLMWSADIVVAWLVVRALWLRWPRR